MVLLTSGGAHGIVPAKLAVHGSLSKEHSHGTWEPGLRLVQVGCLLSACMLPSQLLLRLSSNLVWAVYLAAEDCSIVCLLFVAPAALLSHSASFYVDQTMQATP